MDLSAASEVDAVRMVDEWISSAKFFEALQNDVRCRNSVVLSTSQPQRSEARARSKGAVSGPAFCALP